MRFGSGGDPSAPAVAPAGPVRRPLSARLPHLVRYRVSQPRALGGCYYKSVRTIFSGFLLAAALPAWAAISIDAAKTGVLAPNGVNVTYAVTMTNQGDTTMPDDPAMHEMIDNVQATLVNISATATAGAVNVDHVSNQVTWNGSIAPAATVTVTILGQVRSGAPAGTVINNQAGVFWQGSSTATNIVTFTVPSRVVSGSIAKTQLTPSPVTAGSGAGNLAYRVTATALASNPRSTAMQVRETFPAVTGVTLVSVVPSHGVWDPALNTWDTGELLAGQSATLDVTMTVATTAPIGTNVFQNTAELIGGSWEFQAVPPATVSAATSVQAAPAPALRAVVTAVPLDGTFTPGARVALDLEVFNDGNAPQPDSAGDEVIALLPPELQITEATILSGGGSFGIVPADNSARWNGAIPPQTSIRLRVTAVIAANASGTIQSTVTMASATTPVTTPIVIAPAQHAAIPTVDGWALLLLALTLAAAAVMRAG